MDSVKTALDKLVECIKLNQNFVLQGGAGSGKTETLKQVLEYISENYPNAKWLLTLLFRIYDSNQNSSMWPLLYKIAVYLMKRISQKINFQNKDPSFMKDRNLATMLKMAI